ncbi:hypothetical protein KR067_004867 [Drosophila pandora]|nr:hypothetical protein KR067_004867 [Drosophila pandora]
MIERGLNVTLRTKSSNKQRSIMRILVLCICWTTYLLYRGCVMGKIKYDSQKKRMIIHPRNPYTRIIAFLLQLCFACYDFFGVVYISFAFNPLQYYGSAEMAPHKFLETLIISIAMMLFLSKTIRLICWLRSLEWNQYMVQVTNDVISLTISMESSMGPLSWECSYFIIFFVSLFPMIILEIYNYLTCSMYLCALSTMLLQIIYNAYAVYQILLLSWMETLNSFLKNHYNQRLGFSFQRQKLKLVELRRVYSRISNIHKNIDQRWLPVSRMLFSDIVLLSFYWGNIIQCVLYDHSQDATSKWSFLLGKCLGVSLVPLIRIMFVSICNDRLAQLQSTLLLNLLRIDLSASDNHKQNTCATRKLRGLNICLDLQLPGDSLRNNIVTVHHVCGCHFFMEFVFCVMLNALSIVQYSFGAKNMVSFIE